MTAHNRRRGPSRLDNFRVYAALAAALAFALLPLVWGLSTSFKAQIDVHKFPPVWIPSPPTFANYADAVFDVRFGRYLVNTLIVVFASLVLSTVLALHAAWATVRFRFAGREGILLVMWATIMVPGIAVMVRRFHDMGRTG